LEPFVLFIYFLIGVAAPAVLLHADLSVLQKKCGDRFGLTLTRFLYYDDQSEALNKANQAKYIDQILMPRLANFDIEEILGEIRVERADTSKNVQRQLESAENKFNDGDADGALSAYQIIEKVFNRSPSLYFNIGNIEYARGNFDAAVRHYRRGAECAAQKEFGRDDMTGKLGALYYNLGNAYFITKKYARAIEAYKNALDARPDNADALYNLSFCHAMDYEETGDAEKAADAFKKLAEDTPDNLQAWFHYGKCLLRMKKTAQAIECLLRVVGEDIMFYEAWYLLAAAYDESGLTAEAVRAYYTSIQIKPDFIEAYNNLGVLLSAAGRHGEALKVFRNALRIKPGDGELIFNAGMTYYETDRLEEALGEFQTATKLRPEDETALYMLALTHMRAGNADESMAYLELAVQKDPGVAARAAAEPAFAEYAARDEYGRLFSQ